MTPTAVNWIPVAPGAAVGNPGARFSENEEYVFVGLDGVLAQPEHPSSKIRINAAERKRLPRSLLSVEPDKAVLPHY